MSENVESNPSGESPDSPAENSTEVVAEGPTKPFARVKGRIVLPDGKPVKSGVVVFDPIPDRVYVTLPDGSSMIGSRVRIELDKDGRITSDENPYLDIVGCDTDGVTPAGVWSYLIRISTGGITRRAVKSLKAGVSYDLSDLLSGKEEASSSGTSEELTKLVDERLKKFEIDKEWPKVGFYDDGGTKKIGFIESENLKSAFDNNTIFLVNQLSEIVDKLTDFDTNDGSSITIRDAIGIGYQNGDRFDREGLTSTRKYDGIRPGELSEEEKASGKLVAKPVEEENQYFPNEDRETGLTIPEQLQVISKILLQYADAINQAASSGSGVDAKTYTFKVVNEATYPGGKGEVLNNASLSTIIDRISSDNERFGRTVSTISSALTHDIISNTISETLNYTYANKQDVDGLTQDFIALSNKVTSSLPDKNKDRVWKGIAAFAADSDDNAGLVFDDPINEVSWSLAPYAMGGLTLSCQTIRPDFSENIDYIDTTNYPEVFRVETIASSVNRITNDTLYTTFFGNVNLRSEKNHIRSREPSDPSDVTTKKYVDKATENVTSEKKFDLKRFNASTGTVESIPGKSSIEDLVKNYNDLVDAVAALHNRQ